MVRSRSQIPSRHGELVLRPPFEEWPRLARANARVCESWDFEVGGMPARILRRNTRKALTAAAVDFTTRLGVHSSDRPSEPESVIVTGHQPEFYHTGVWVKNFLLQRACEETGATGVDLVLDTDTFGTLGVTAPCLIQDVTRCRQCLSIGSADRCYAGAPLPSAREIEAFCEATSNALASLPTPSIHEHFAMFCDAMREAASRSSNLSELVTGARRRFEGELTGYLELPVTAAARTEPFLRFAADILVDARRFVDIYNAELAVHRRLHGIRSAAHPFPDLEADGEHSEVPFWIVAAGKRSPARVRSAREGIELMGPDGTIALLPSGSRQALTALLEAPVTLAPRALALTLFSRTFFTDLFIHGVGGERYDRVTDAVAKSWWGVDLPRFSVASLSMKLPLGVHVVTDEEISEIDRRLHRLEHNPDEMLGEAGLSSQPKQQLAMSLAEKKRELVKAIQSPDADKKALGGQIRALNSELRSMLGPLAQELTKKKELLESRRSESEILTDRAYPFCFWDPADIADKVWGT